MVVSATLPSTRGAVERVIGRVAGSAPGPTLLCVASIHGNEPAGSRALQQVFASLQQTQPSIRGEFVGVVGNVAALNSQKRYVDLDLNRCWLPERIEALRRGRTSRTAAEDTELVELLGTVEEVAERARGVVHILDLHTTSGESKPFATIGDTLRNRAFATRLRVPLILGLEEHLEGTLLEYVNNLGHVTAGLEGGQHDDQASVDHLAAGVWLALDASAVLVHPRTVAAWEGARGLLARSRAGVPSVLEVRHRHPVRRGDGFTMMPGWATFQPVRKGDVLARDAGGDVRSPHSGRVLMPLYQAQGDDGFFVVRPVRPFWRRVSALLRRVRADRLAHWLPGVRRDRDRPGTLLVNRTVARWYVLELFHLLGYRRERVQDRTLVVSRRRHDEL